MRSDEAQRRVSGICHGNDSNKGTLAPGGEQREAKMTDKTNLASIDKSASDREEAERRNLEMHARLEACLISVVPSDPVSTPRPAPAEERPSFWQAIKTMLK